MVAQKIMKDMQNLFTSYFVLMSMLLLFVAIRLGWCICSGDDRHRDRAYLVENFNDFPSHYFKVNTDFATDIVSIVLT